MRNGRPPVPAHLRLVDGSADLAKHRKRVAAEPKAAGRLLAPPDWFTAQQKAAWSYAIENAPKGLLKLIDRGALAAWVVAEDTHRRATEMLNQAGAENPLNGLLAKTPKGVVVQHPLAILAMREALVMLKAADALGFRPVSRARTAVDPRPDRDDPADEFFRD